jgi:tetratricopeptide (TPR) repeat protein
MVLTNKQALQQAVEAHKAGKLQDAEALYRAILQAQPKHPDANHNLGVMAVSLNKTEAAIPLFKIALEANPNQEQFWLSYVDALIKTNQLETAKNVLEQGKKLGLAGERVDALEMQLTPIAVVEESESILQKQASFFTQQRKKASTKKEKKKNSPLNQTNLNQARSPSQVEVNTLLEHYQKGRYDLAENLAKTITQKYPDHQFSWKVLGAVFKQTGRLQESLISIQTAVAISLNDAKAHSNLGNTLKELGRLEETEASYRKAISLKPDYEASQYNIGIWYREQGQHKQAAEQFLKSKNFKNSQSYLLLCWYFLNEQSLFYEQLESLTGQGITDALIGSFGCRAEIKFSIQKANPFCSYPLNYVFKTDLRKKYDFEGKFVKPTLSIFNDRKIQNRSQNLLTNGLQTSGNLFALENILIDEIKKIIELEIENYRLHFKDSKEGLIQNWPDTYSLYGWLIRMKNGGALRPHMHEKGWISGSIYINVPPKLNINEGNLVVCIEDDALLSESQDNKKNIIDVSTGSLCLFPASLLHYTIPFESDEDRIVLAFDVVPKKKEVL